MDRILRIGLHVQTWKMSILQIADVRGRDISTTPGIKIGESEVVKIDPPVFLAE
ncbi:hypothetical protein VSU19_22280 [Verrucomicrobiales bacterium BCK34]|nr:hypothetical protein [Verrucomicrobiales bacterium BCK34]